MVDQTVLCIGADDDVEDMAAALDEEADLAPIARTSVAEATAFLDTESVAAVVTEYELSDGTGLDVVDAIRDHAPQTPCVLYTDVSPSDIDTASFEDAIVEYLNRDLPDAADRLGFVVDDVIAHSAQVGFLVPDDEDSRLAALDSYDVDDLPIEESFDRLTDLISSHFDTAVAFIGLIDEQEEDILACTGGDWDSITREETICTHSMLQEDVMVVEDISEDKRFAQNQQLHDLGIVSYAGANMTTPEGQTIGQVCLIDHERRSYSPEQRAQLQQFAETAMEILELRQSLLEASDAEVAP
ncbi:GAF domain-containing protein [Halorussus marinus]|uniref:GAF domain-containing protein n=1 Tax=Halorussus marinus TaxID=2505976 RepID=UPI00106E8A32|nr:GAF domain-containing protein [Halorussus marinus]